MKHSSTIKNFKSYCNSNCCPKYISKYVDGLSDDEFILFYNEVNLAASYLIDEDYLFYKMFWIMKYPWNNLSEELFLQLFFNIEGYDLSKIITESKYDELSNKFISSLEGVLIQEDTDQSSYNDNTLPV